MHARDGLEASLLAPTERLEGLLFEDSDGSPSNEEPSSAAAIEGNQGSSMNDRTYLDAIKEILLRDCELVSELPWWWRWWYWRGHIQLRRDYLSVKAAYEASFAPDSDIEVECLCYLN
jgi:hypothetical protein